MDIYNQTSFKTSKFITKSYSTSFYMSTRLLEQETQKAIFAIYGFVRFADEIVDTFHEFDKEQLLTDFESDLKKAIANKVSMNPVLHAFQLVVNHYKIQYELIDAFMRSMRADLQKQIYESKHETENYIFGSANVVGLMCLKVFTNGDEIAYEKLREPAMKLGSAFQKVNFLRDLHTDIHDLQRFYFGAYDFKDFNEEAKCSIIDEIKVEFDEAYAGIQQLPGRSKLAVLTAYFYYLSLLKKIETTPACEIMDMRVRVPNFIKTLLLIKAMFMYKLKLI
ncbi:MAG: phytoene/squalene synthase family protein [Paludibacter sp.]|nr:phytoene/squalene synthase family protein [Paludibacter sp.]